MDIQTLIDHKNEGLYTRIKAHFNIQLIENKDWREEAWSSSIENDTVVIKYCSTAFPKAAFAHELLHIKEVCTGISLHKETQHFLPTIGKYLNITFPKSGFFVGDRFSALEIEKMNDE